MVQALLCRYVSMYSPPASLEAQRTQRRNIFPDRETAIRKKQLPLRGNKKKQCLSELCASVVKKWTVRFATKKKIEKFQDINDLTGAVIGAAIEVHKVIGPGLLESTYEVCLCHELELREIPFEKQKNLLVEYKGVRLDCGYRLDIIIAGKLIVELKACDRLLPIHDAQLLTYLKLTGLKVGLLINFNVPVLKEGIKRFVL